MLQSSHTYFDTMNTDFKTWGKLVLYWSFIPALLIIFFLIWGEISYQQDLTRTVSKSSINNRLVIESGTAMINLSDKLNYEISSLESC